MQMRLHMRSAGSTDAYIKVKQWFGGDLKNVHAGMFPFL